MRKKLIFLLFIITALSIAIFSACNNSQIYIVTYEAQEGGYIEGKARQEIFEGKNTSEVTAISDENYRFVKWSDEFAQASRTDENIQSDTTFIAIFEKYIFQFNYYASDGGYLQGETSQKINKDEAAPSTVIAIPYEGYRFVKWSDGFTEMQRQDALEKDISVTAEFEIISKTFTYEYNNATENTTEKSLTVSYFDNLNEKLLPTPQRINSTFEGWYADKEFKTQISDENGNISYNQNLTILDSECLYAKFSLIKEAKHKVLMVYVTSLDGNFTTIDGTNIEFSYTLTENEKQICHIMTKKFQEELNDIFKGLVSIEVEEYFTQQTISETEFEYDIAYGASDYRLYASNIPELSKEYLDQYGSVMTSVKLDDQNRTFRLHYGLGVSRFKFSCCYFNALSANQANYDIEKLLDENDPQWVVPLGIYIHEFTHTVEYGEPFGRTHCYHDTLEYYTQQDPKPEEYAEFYYNNKGGDIGVSTLYLLNRAKLNGKQVGIPYEFWTGDLDIYFDVEFVIKFINHSANQQNPGIIQGLTKQHVKLGEYAEKVIAIPNDDFKFVGWDKYSSYTANLLEPELTYGPVSYNQTIFASFEKYQNLENDYFSIFFMSELDGKASEEGGIIYGNWIQTIKYNEYTEKVTAIPNEGYRFVMWSDGSTNPDLIFGPVKHGNIIFANFKKIDDNVNTNLIAKLKNNLIPAIHFIKKE